MQLGGMGFVHYNMSLEEQLAAVQQAKAVSPLAAAAGRPAPTVGPSGCAAAAAAAALHQMTPHQMTMPQCIVPPSLRPRLLGIWDVTSSRDISLTAWQSLVSNACPGAGSCGWARQWARGTRTRSAFGGCMPKRASTPSSSTPARVRDKVPGTRLEIIRDL